MKTLWVWWKSQLSPHQTYLSPTTPIPLLGTHPQLLNLNAMRLRLTHLDSIPKIKIPKQELAMTICTTDTIGTIRSRRLFWLLFDSGLNVSIIRRSALPKGVITKLLGDTKLVRTLTGCLKTQEVVTMQDLIFPEFDKNRRINQQTSVWQQQRQI